MDEEKETPTPPDHPRTGTAPAQQELPSPVDSRPGEDIVDGLNERDGYTEVLKRVPCAGGCDECPCTTSRWSHVQRAETRPLNVHR